ncbi:TonB family protein [Pantoea sp. VS1]|uniref:TonB family protein n=1 Tax=Pantoea sp. VS1 TaxID=2003658 RepID=UPI001594FF4F|nr:TonB family protein [Pantoea sp. VS1]
MTKSFEGKMKTALNTDLYPDGLHSCPNFSRSPVLKGRGAALFSSIIFHVLLLTLYVCCKNSSPTLEEEGGRAGSPVAFVAFNATSMSPAEAETAAEDAPLLVPVPVVRHAVIATEHKEPPPKPKQVKKTLPVEKTQPAPSAKKTVERPPVSKEEASGMGDTQTLENSQTASTASGQGGASTMSGESTTGRAASGAGSAATVHLHILNRRVNYPSRARSMGVEGRVKAQFDINESGTIKNIRILAEDPPGVFGADLKRDISRWRYDTTGEVKDQIVTVIFKIDGRIQVVN